MAMLAVYCIIVSPILLLALGFLAASTQAIYYDHRDRVILGKTIKKEDQFKLVREEPVLLTLTASFQIRQITLMGVLSGWQVASCLLFMLTCAIHS